MLNPLFKTPENKSKALGEELFENVSSFFAWYEWVRHANDSPDGIRDLLTIMLITQCQTLTAEQEKGALQKLETVRESLDGGTMRFDQIPQALNRILEFLIEANPRSRLIHYALKIEIAMRLKNKSPSDELVTLMEEMMKRVQAYMPTIQAEAIAYRLQQFLESPLSDKDIGELKNHLWTLMK
ncbi:hypothetical protein [Simkania negevensis]|uniref:Carbamoyl phosphate synthase ATP-binding domain-containing protein n=1 Tax=Simkania negevensis (strain ATCC VR-1471 / DSM 27360 / Z) TaxID=331113 RepID=F8L9Q4_SIMNZ|nr:hypothetical protein [Simkania negevensis]CCB89594.1 unknown protein [Simkania negevensis Z]